MISTDALHLGGIIAPAFVASGLIVLTHAPLGIIVLKRGIIFMDLAIAQIAGLGLIMASLLTHNAAVIQLGALSTACLGALIFRYTDKKVPQYQEAIIGVGFVVAVAAVMLVLADHPMSSEMTHQLVSGQILFITWRDVLHHAPIYIGISLLCRLNYHKSFFYLLFAIAITSSVQLVGVYVVFSSLILPALAAVNARNPIRRAWLCGGVSVTAGLLISVITALPAGPVLVMTFSSVSLIVVLYQSLRANNAN